MEKRLPLTALSSVVGKATGSGPRCQDTILGGAEAQIGFEGNVNPTIYTSCIEQFWATSKVKTVNGERGTDCLPTATIFEELARMGKQRKTMKGLLNLSASTEPMTEKETNEESVPKHSYDLSQSGEDRMQLHELMNLYTKLSDRVLALETTKTTQRLRRLACYCKSKVRMHLHTGRIIDDLDVDGRMTIGERDQEMAMMTTWS
ncbi:hypothetical protein Tco_0797394 [Tanacetum coccineum]